MIAIKQLYELVKTTVLQIPAPGSPAFGETGFIPLIKKFDWWNDNLIQQPDQTSYPTPAVFFEVAFMSWLPTSKGSVKNNSTLNPEQSGQGEFILHIVHKKIDSSSEDASELAHIDEVNLVFRAVHFLGSDESFLQGPVQRVRDETVLTHQVLRDWPMSFNMSLFECAQEDETLAEVTPWDPDITVEAEEPYTDEGPGLTIQLN